MTLVCHATNPDGRDFFVGDLHGRLDLLTEAMARVGFDPWHDRLFSVGDLIDRGEDSLGCLALTREPWFFAVRGNHEAMALQALSEGAGAAWDLWQRNGGRWVFLETVARVRQALEAARPLLPLAREVAVGSRRLGVVHAEPPDQWGSIDAAPAERLVWARERIARRDSRRVQGIDAVVVGHTIVDSPRLLGNVLYLDTGAFTSERLTLLEAGDVLALVDAEPEARR